MVLTTGQNRESTSQGWGAWTAMGTGIGTGENPLSSPERFWDVVRVARGGEKPLGRWQRNPDPLCLPEAVRPGPPYPCVYFV